MDCGGRLIIDYTIGPFKHRVNYVVNYGSNLEKLRRQVDDLSNASEDLEMLADSETRKGRRILPRVERWMKKVAEIIIEANKLLEECQAKAKCIPVKARYQRSKEATTLAERVVELLDQKEKFSNSVSYDAPTQERLIIPTRDYEPLTSRISLVERILKEFENVKMSLIGVFGIGGVGKTILAQEMVREAKKLTSFDDVVLVLDVKQIPNLEKLQKEIAQSLGLEFREEETIGKRADRLFDRMKNKKVLVILDDVLEEIDLEKVGLHSGVCKILMTSRRRQVFSSPKMCTQKDFFLETLDEEETWCLFAKIAGDVVQDSKIERVAIEVANRCGGLPVLVVTVAAALKNKNNIHVWKDAWRRLKNFGDKEEGLQEKAFEGIEWSYNQLDDDETKKFLLFCCALKCPFLDDLLKYCFGMGLFSNNIQTVEEVRDKLHALVEKLKDSCLFLDGDSNEEIKLHDLVREVGISIKCKDENILSMQKGQELKEWPNNDSLKNCTMMDFSSLDIFCGFPNQSLEYPKLEFFSFEQHSIGLHSIPSNFFKEMTALKVLDLTEFNMKSLPSSFVALKNLKTLCLDRSILGDISLVGQLRNLEILSFIQSRFKQLPKEIGQLTHLRLLDLSYCSELEAIAPNLLSSLTSLEELKLRNSFNRWNTEGNANLSELKKLSHLATLEIHIPNDSLLPMNLFSNKLENFKILIGDTWDWSDVFEETSNKVLKLKLVGSSQLDIGLKRLLKKSEFLYLDEMRGVDNIFSQLDSECFQCLKHLHIQNNPQIRYVILSSRSSSSNINVFPILESLVLQNLSTIEHLCSGQLKSKLFRSLRSIKVQRCPNLKTLLSFSIAKCLSQLEVMVVVDCNIMEEIVGQEKKDDDHLRNKADAIIEFKKMKSLTLQSLPKLVGFSSIGNTIDDASKRTNELLHANQDSSKIIEEIDIKLFSGEVQFPNLAHLEVSYLNKVTTIWSNKLPPNSFCALKEVKIEHCQSVETFVKHHHAFLSNLNSIEIRGCPNLKNVIPASLAGSLQGLEQLVIEHCGALEEILKKEEEQEKNQLIMFEFPKVELVKFLYLPQLRSFYGGMHSSKWPLLTHLKVVLGLNNNIVQILAKELLSFQEKCKTDNLCAPMKRPLFLIEKDSFPNLKILTLSAAMEVCDDSITADYLRRVKDFQFDCNSINSSNIFLSNCFRYFRSSFEGLSLTRAPFSEIIVDDDIKQEFVNDNHGMGSISKHTVGTLLHLKAFCICDMPWLTNLWKENSQPASTVLPVLPNLEYLQVGLCHRLKNIVSSAISFRNLTDLIVVSCQGLKYLVTYPVARGLTQLKSMTVRDCKRMRVILESNDGDYDDGNNINSIEIVFGELRYLELQSLPSLGGFCSRNDHCCYVKVPSLKTLYMTDCNIVLTISDEGVLLQSHSNLERLQQITTQLDANDDETVPVQDIDDSWIHGEIDVFYDNDETIFELSQNGFLCVDQSQKQRHSVIRSSSSPC